VKKGILAILVFLGTAFAQQNEHETRRLSADALKQIYRSSLPHRNAVLIDVTRFDGWEKQTEYTAILIHREVDAESKDLDHVTSTFAVVRMFCDEKCTSALSDRAQRETDEQLVETPPSAGKGFHLQEVTVTQREVEKLFSSFGVAAQDAVKELTRDNLENVKANSSSFTVHAPHYHFEASFDPIGLKLEIPAYADSAMAIMRWLAALQSKYFPKTAVQPASH
jgi:hypothetical protein